MDNGPPDPSDKVIKIYKRALLNIWKELTPQPPKGGFKRGAAKKALLIAVSALTEVELKTTFVSVDDYVSMND